METILAKARADYDIVLVDAPPLLPVTDGALLAAQANGAIMVVRRGKTTRDQLSEAYQRLMSVDARVLGAVLNMTPERGSDSYGYGYGYAPLPPTKGRRAGK
jgi:receptor protein-tyrosine kinase